MPSLFFKLASRFPFLQRLSVNRARLKPETARLQTDFDKRWAALTLREERLVDISAQVSNLETELCSLRKRCGELESALSQSQSVDRRKTKNGMTQPSYPPGHFYSPLVDPNDRWVQESTKTELAPSDNLSEFGIDEEEVLRWFEVIAAHYSNNPFPQRPTVGHRYYYDNPAFPLADALAMLGFMVDTQPRRYIEVGAGFSSCAAIDISELYLNRQVDFTFIDPHPESIFQLLGEKATYRDRVMRVPLQDVALEKFTQLEEGDILFLDSSHVVKTGSDVLDFYFRILPQLRPGVLVHIHDIFFPFEYPENWIADENRSWNEVYFLRAFLSGNRSLRVLYFSDWLYKCRRDLVQEKMPNCIQHRGGLFWMKTM